MKITLSWLLEFLVFDEGRSPSSSTYDPDFVSSVVTAMNELGMVVEGVEFVSPDFQGVVVGEVLEISSIPGADRIREVLVRADEAEPVSVVCGANNFEVGDLVPFAKVGATLGGDFLITQRRMRGVISNGMLCSAKELSLGGDSAGLLILPPRTAIGEPLEVALGVEPDVVFDLAIEANRPDANCVIGVARDLAPKLKAVFKSPPEVELPIANAHMFSGASVSDPSLCSRLVLAQFDGPFPKEVDKRVSRRLTLCGIRSISTVVDVSNYVMLELGQPTHPYDCATLNGGYISVRGAVKDETITTLDAVPRALLSGSSPQDPPDIVIVDGADHVVALGGVMGSLATEMNENSKSVLFEFANFSKSAIARTSKRLGLRTEASARFERGVDPNIIEAALSRVGELLAMTPSRCHGIVNSVEPPKSISLRLARITQLLGIECDGEKVAQLLDPIGFSVSQVDTDERVAVVVPSFRPDCDEEIDLIEEIARHFGYENISKQMVYSPNVGKLTPAQSDERKVRSFLRDRGLFEAWGPTLLSSLDHSHVGIFEEVIYVKNPLSVDESVLRSSLLPGILKALRLNVSRRNKELRFFEIGRVFSPSDEELPNETTRLAGLVTHSKDPSSYLIELVKELIKLLDIRSIELLQGIPLQLSQLRELGYWPSMRDGRAGIIYASGEPIGVVGELPSKTVDSYVDSSFRERVGWLELDFGKLLCAERRHQVAKIPSIFTSSDLDMSFEIPLEVSASQLTALIREVVDPLGVDVRLFDSYSTDANPETKSLAVRVRLESMDSNISDLQISEIIDRADELVSARLRGRLRRN